MAGFSPLIYNGQDVWLNDIPFNYVDDAGNIWVISDIDGWWGLPDVEADEDVRPYTQDGSYFTSGRYPGRNINVSGSIVPRYDPNSGYDPAVQARNLLNSRLNMVRALGLFRVNEGPDKLAVVQLVGRPLAKFDKLNNVLKFSFQLKASDPRKYSVDETVVSSTLAEPDSGRAYPRMFSYSYAGLSTGETFVVDNQGSYDTSGVFTIYGPVSNPYIEHVDLGSIIRLNTTLASGEYITVDLNGRKIVLNGTASRKNVLDTRSKWFLIQPGINLLRYRGMQQIPPNPGAPELINLAVNPAANGSGGWISTQNDGATDDYLVARDTTVVRRVGSTSVAMSGNPASTYYATSQVIGSIQAVGTNGSNIAIEPGQDYTFSIWAQADAPGIADITLGVDFFDGSSVYLSSTSSSTGVSASPSNWVNVSTTFSTPSDAAFVKLKSAVVAPIVPGTLGIIVRFADSILIEGITAYDYFDGSYTGAVWDGTRNQSTSTKSAVEAVPQSVVEFRYRSAWIE